MSGGAGSAWSGIPVHRIEAFSDAVFAFAVTLLVVSLEVPHSAHELFAELRGFLAFGVCFVLLITFWVEHSRFFKRYPLNDGRTVALNMLLLFVLLLYVYPLKFLFSALADALVWGDADTHFENLAQFRVFMLIYGAGFLALNAILLLMKRNAAHHGEALALSAVDRLRLQGSSERSLANCLVAIASMLIVLFTNDRGLFSGCIYALIGPILWYLRVRNDRQIAALHAAGAVAVPAKG